MVRKSIRICMFILELKAVKAIFVEYLPRLQAYIVKESLDIKLKPYNNLQKYSSSIGLVIVVRKI